jgi:hypothetical protein
MLIIVEETGKDQLEKGRGSMWNAPVLSLCSLIRNPLPKPTGVLERCRAGENNYWFFIFRGVSFGPHP